VNRKTNDGVRWQLDPAFARHLDDVLRSAGRPVKTTPVSTVAVHTAGGRAYYVKRYLHERVKGRPFKYWFKPSPARREWSMAARLQARNLPIVRHVALGERWGWGLRESILITESFDGEPLGAAADFPYDQVLALIERMHAQGVLQRDLHPANLLWSPQSRELRLVDLHGIVLRASLSDEERQANLAYLVSALPSHVPAPPQIRSQARILRRELLAIRSRRCLKRNRDFDTIQIGGLQWHYRKSRRGDALESLMADPDGFLNGASDRLKTGRSSTVGSRAGLVLKRYNFKKVLNALKDLFRPSKARRAYLKGYHLELADIPTARVVASAERRFAGVLQSAYLVMEEIPNAIALSDCKVRTPELIARVARLLAKLHDQGFTHRDLKASNILLDPARTPHLIDMEGLRFVETVPAVQAGRDLERLARSLSDQGRLEPADVRRFVRLYCRERRIRPAQLRPFQKSSGQRRRP
jgi:tRNA A-37 threonylcarbamoyl transferase component Bud32